MKFLATSAAVLLAAIHTVSATTVTFYRAGPNSDSYTLSPTFQGANFTIDNPLSVSSINVDSNEGVCTFKGVDGLVTLVVGARTVDVGPPQVQVSGQCCGFSCIGFPEYCCGE